MRGAGLRFLFFVHHCETSSNSPALEKRTLPEFCLEAVSSYSSEVNVSPLAVLSACAEMLLLRGHWSANKDRCDGSISPHPHLRTRAVGPAASRI